MILNLNDEVVSDFLGFLIGRTVYVRTASLTCAVECLGSAGDEEEGDWGMLCAYVTDPPFIIPWDDIEEIEVL